MWDIIKRGRPKEDEVERFRSKYVIDPETGCWTWTAALGKDGYGMFSAGVNKQRNGSRTILAHRWSYIHYKGPIPDGLEVDHTCFNRKCVNPSHLEAVLGVINEDRMIKRYYSR